MIKNILSKNIMEFVKIGALVCVFFSSGNLVFAAESQSHVVVSSGVVEFAVHEIEMILDADLARGGILTVHSPQWNLEEVMSEGVVASVGGRSVEISRVNIVDNVSIEFSFNENFASGEKLLFEIQNVKNSSGGALFNLFSPSSSLKMTSYFSTQGAIKTGTVSVGATVGATVVVSSGRSSGSGGGSSSRTKTNEDSILVDVDDLSDGEKVILLKGYGAPDDAVVVYADNIAIAEIIVGSSGYFESPVIMSIEFETISVSSKDSIGDSHSISIPVTEGLIDLNPFILKPKIISIPIGPNRTLVVMQGPPGALVSGDNFSTTTLNADGYGFFFSDIGEISSRHTLWIKDAIPYLGTLIESTPEPPVAVACSEVFTKNMTLGARGEDVVLVQRFLEDQGFSVGSIDGIFGKILFDAIINFQEKYRSEVLVPVRLAEGSGAWFAYSRAKANSLLCDSGEGLPALVEVKEAPLCDGALIENRLERGDEGVEVRKLQEFLFRSGFYRQTIDGLFGARTEKAVRRFQDKYHVDVLLPAGLKRATGIFAENTKMKINSMICGL